MSQQQDGLDPAVARDSYAQLLRDMLQAARQQVNEQEVAERAADAESLVRAVNASPNAAGIYEIARRLVAASPNAPGIYEIARRLVNARPNGPAGPRLPRRTLEYGPNGPGGGPLATRLTDPFGQFNFVVELEGITAGGFREVEGLGMHVEPIELQDGTDFWPRKRPGRKRFDDLRLKKGFVGRDALFAWMLETMRGNLSRRSGAVIVNDDAGQPVVRYNFFEAWPKGWSGIRFDGNSAGVLVEELELVVERLELA